MAGTGSAAAVLRDAGTSLMDTGTPAKTLIATDRLNEEFRVMDSSHPWAQTATIDGELRVGNGFTAAEHPDLLRLLSALDTPLADYTAAGTHLELSVQNRGRPGQLTTLGCWIVGWSHLAATSTRTDLTGALTEVSDDLRRQLDAKTTSDREIRARASAQVTAHTPHTDPCRGTSPLPVPPGDTTAGTDPQSPSAAAGLRARESQQAAETVAHRGRLRSALVGFVEPYEKWRDRKNTRKQFAEQTLAGRRRITGRH